jgi:hypothetical protein
MFETMAEQNGESLGINDFKDFFEETRWSVALSRSPTSSVEEVTLTCDEEEAVGVLAHQIRIIPEYDLESETFMGYRVEYDLECRESPTEVESRIPRLSDAIEVAIHQMAKLEK